METHTFCQCENPIITGTASKICSICSTIQFNNKTYSIEEFKKHIAPTAEHIAIACIEHNLELEQTVTLNQDISENDIVLASSGDEVIVTTVDFSEIPIEVQTSNNIKFRVKPNEIIHQ